MTEFDLINRFFRRPSTRSDVALGIGDDAALLTMQPLYELVAAVDTIVEGVHFPAGTAAYDIGYRALAVNLSDLAAMGSKPAWCTLSLSLPQANEEWMQDFARGFFDLATAHQCELVGGDTVRGPLVITVQVMGTVEQGTALRRSGAQVGDGIFVTHMTGEAAAGLALVQSPRTPSASTQHLIDRFLHPTPRVAIGRALRTRATAAMDVSDGLLIDLQRLCAASGVAAELDLHRRMLSSQMRELFDEPTAWRFALSGGDDYELLYTMPSERASYGTLHGVRIGTIVAGAGVTCRIDGAVHLSQNAGYDHFAAQ
ncbi:MAG: thiamine-phosphate kinase [Steroidobacteraceae bacterium]